MDTINQHYCLASANLTDISHAINLICTKITKRVFYLWRHARLDSLVFWLGSGWLVWIISAGVIIVNGFLLLPEVNYIDIFHESFIIPDNYVLHAIFTTEQNMYNG